MIIRTPKKTQFTVISNALIEDRRLSWAATGMLIYLLSKPDHWRIPPAQLIKERHLGRDRLYALLKELEQAGYARKEKARGESGALATDWWVFDVPIASPPDTAEPSAPAPSMEGPGDTPPAAPAGDADRAPP